MARRSRAPVYPEGDQPNGVVFYLIEEARLPRQDCQDIVREIAVEFAQNGPFVVRVGIRPQGERYWLGFNATECGDAFEGRINIRAYKIAKQARISGPNPNPPLNRAIPEAEYNSYQPGGGEPEEEPWVPEAAPAAGPPAVEYADRHHGVVFYRLDRTEIDPAIAIEAVQDIAGIMLIQMGRAKPFALRYGVRQESVQYYWIGLNSTTAGVLFERTLKELLAHVTKRSKLPDGSQPVLRLVLNLPGVPVVPLPPQAAARPAPAPLPPLPPPPPSFEPGPGPVDVDLEEPAAADRDRMAGVRRVDVGRLAGRLRALGRRRRGGGDA